MPSNKGSSVPILFENPSRCCGCLACAEVCPVQAISIYTDDGGFVYPIIDEATCVRCGSCKHVCGFQQETGQTAAGVAAFAAATREYEIELSASGGVFGALARATVDAGGTVFGCSYERDEGGLSVRHRSARTRKELVGLYGSKYVQSSTNGCFGEVKRELNADHQVLFSGTPCQVAGLRRYLGRDYDNLLTVDIVCHGVPSEEMFRAYLNSVSDGQKIVDARFRSKRDGWDKSLLLELVFENGEHEFIRSQKSSYYDLFLCFDTFRDSCYTCPFAGALRPGDLSIGDFWGVEKVRPDLLEGNDGLFNLRRGISCLLVNTNTGLRWLDSLGMPIVCKPILFEDAARHNDQLCHPAQLPANRNKYLEAYTYEGWQGVERLWKPHMYRKLMIEKLKCLVPDQIKIMIKRAMGRDR